MPRATKTRPGPSRRDARTTGESSKWVRKNMRIDQKKLDEVKRLLRVSTETQAVDAALQEVAFRPRPRGANASAETGRGASGLR